MALTGFVGTVLRKVFGSRNDRLLKRYGRVADEVTSLEPQIRSDYDARFASAATKVGGELTDDERATQLQQIRIELSSDLRAGADKVRARLQAGESPQACLTEAFALVREASRRAKNHRHFDCQLIGGQVLYEGKIAEMKTGEGKTIVCHLAAFLKILEGKKVHIVTVNDYLVKRDAEFARAVFELLGFTVGYIQSQVDPGGREGIRAQAYACNITYGTNNEFGFDYLRDNMKTSLEEQVQGRLDFAIIDEVDSILIDEARTPLIISGPADDDVTRYRTADAVARVLMGKQTAAQNAMSQRVRDWGDNPPAEFADNPKFKDGVRKFKVDPNWLTEDEAEALGHKPLYIVAKERKSVTLTHEGITLAQEQLGVGSLYVGSNMEWPHLVENAVRGHVIYGRDVDYVVKDGEIIIVDSFTGRLMHGRQWSDGLHQAIEAKEGVKVKEESQTLATITLQNFFKLYESISGMTGTAMTEADEFMKIYRLEVVAIPTNRPVNRQDYNDRIHKNVEEKYAAIVEEIHDIHTKGRPGDPFVLAPALKHLVPILQKTGKSPEKAENALATFKKGEGDGAMVVEAYDEAMGDLSRGRPVLVGTVSVENSEKLSNLLTRRYGIEHEVLNAKFHEREAEIVAKAGETHSTSRGRDKTSLGNVTIATNMAGRGTDIKLQQGVVYQNCIGDLGPPENDNGRKYGWHEKGVIGTKCCIHCPDYDPKTNCAHCWKPKLDPRFPELGRKVCPLVVPCGLHIVGTERHESRRIDNQLRGRSGRQGDPGSSRFFLSLADDLLRMFMGEWTLKMLEKTGFQDGMAMEAKSLSKGIAKAQKKVEEKNFGVRKHLLEYDEVMDHQRKVFYTQRQQILSAARPGKAAFLINYISEMIDKTIEAAAGRLLAKDFSAQCVSDWVKDALDARVDAKIVEVDDLIATERNIRADAKGEAHNQVTMTVGEYMDPDLDPKQWDIRGLHRWGETNFGVKISQNQLREMSVEEVQHAFIEAADAKIDAFDLAPIEKFLDHEYGKLSLLAWTQQKFGVEISADEVRSLSNDELVKLITSRVHIAYLDREVRYPVEWILGRTILNERAEAALSAEALVQWANLKFNLGWTIESLQNRSVKEIAEELFELNRQYVTQGKFEKEIDAALVGGNEPAAWARTRFGPAFDEDLFKSAESPREALLTMGRDLLRREVTLLERYVLLQTYDQAWKEHMYAVDMLKDSIGLRGYAEQDPKIAYKREGFQMFQEMLDGIQDKVTSIIFKARLADDSTVQSRYRIGAVQHAESTGQGFAAVDRGREAAMQAQGAPQQKIETIRRDQPRVGRNDPCTCGSGKKYKQCCGRK